MSLPYDLPDWTFLWTAFRHTPASPWPFVEKVLGDWLRHSSCWQSRLSEMSPTAFCTQHGSKLCAIVKVTCATLKVLKILKILLQSCFSHIIQWHPWWETTLKEIPLMRYHSDDEPSWWGTTLMRPTYWGTTLLWDQPTEGLPWGETTLLRDHPDEGPPWGVTTLRRDHPDERPPSWGTTLKRDQPIEGLPWWDTTLLRDHPDEGPPWGETTLFRDYPHEGPPWGETTQMRDHPVEGPPRGETTLMRDDPDERLVTEERLPWWETTLTTLEKRSTQSDKKENLSLWVHLHGNMIGN